MVVGQAGLVNGALDIGPITCVEYLRNADDGKAWLGTIDSALSGITGYRIDRRELGTQSGHWVADDFQFSHILVRDTAYRAIEDSLLGPVPDLQETVVDVGDSSFSVVLQNDAEIVVVTGEYGSGQAVVRHELR